LRLPERRQEGLTDEGQLPLIVFVDHADFTDEHGVRGREWRRCLPGWRRRRHGRWIYVATSPTSTATATAATTTGGQTQSNRCADERAAENGWFGLSDYAVHILRELPSPDLHRYRRLHRRPDALARAAGIAFNMG
jgi:hypothetical protein